MRKIFGIATMLTLVAGMLGVLGSISLGSEESIAAEVGPLITAATPMVKLDKDSEAIIMGTGFKPEQEVRLLITTPDGIETDIASYMEPAPKADATGTWASTWLLSYYVRRQLVTAGACKITATDYHYNSIAHTAMFFQAPEEEKDNKKKN